MNRDWRRNSSSNNRTRGRSRSTNRWIRGGQEQGLEKEQQ